MADTLAILETSYGRVVVDLFEETAPLHAENFKNLVRRGTLKGTYFHRIIPNFVVQGGDPNTLNDSREDDGMGGIGERIPAEIGQPHLRGSVGAARDNNPAKASSGSQFYFCLAPLPQLDGNYTVFGTVVEGMSNVDLMAQVPTDRRDNPIESIFITNTTLMDKAEFNKMKSDAS
ncbi:MAG: peptidylprolyl isomerase [Candidatus Marinimicrobia bacterium]|nr:peptidylprolyl isomerase [Candidatus Neomarinimicrobiota bacterium]MCF7840054.1 peptidylprolyl isomerase [Candidatus Neomarinimicrobiota bacterium]MCF7902934.1 peptidylprolyl isomerase [Candidatus Neomarinimicrobiota bacterium]